uniref:sulfiredoxin n=1 Tax=Ananas comosus var. bracteatus TaxID=296719 RepID=A0A6V7NKH3_ANACO|nr:unnamed protein product [Ananas comosus var. bracteatus]
MLTFPFRFKRYFEYEDPNGTPIEIWRQVSSKLPLIKLMINRDKRLARSQDDPDCSSQSELPPTGGFRCRGARDPGLGLVGGGGGGGGPAIVEIPLEQIRRPLISTRANDPAKVCQLMDSIRQIGLQEPIDVLEVDGVYYGFSGCHRFEAHQRLGLPTIRCKVRRGTKETLRHHMR